MSSCLQCPPSNLWSSSPPPAGYNSKQTGTRSGEESRPEEQGVYILSKAQKGGDFGGKMILEAKTGLKHLK